MHVELYFNIVFNWYDEGDTVKREKGSVAVQYEIGTLGDQGNEEGKSRFGY